jgi:hypothetical protein
MLIVVGACAPPVERKSSSSRKNRADIPRNGAVLGSNSAF